MRFLLSQVLAVLWFEGLLVELKPICLQVHALQSDFLAIENMHCVSSLNIEH